MLQPTSQPLERKKQHSHVNHIAVLRMNHSRHAQLPGAHQDVEHLAIRQLHGRVRHVQLDTGDALAADHSRQLIAQDRLRRPRQDQMEPVVDVALARRAPVVFLDNRQQRGIGALLRRKRQDRRVAACQCGPRPAEPFVPRRRVVLV